MNCMDLVNNPFKSLATRKLSRCVALSMHSVLNLAYIIKLRPTIITFKSRHGFVPQMDRERKPCFSQLFIQLSFLRYIQVILTWIKGWNHSYFTQTAHFCVHWLTGILTDIAITLSLSAHAHMVTAIVLLTIIVGNGDIGCCRVEHDTFIRGVQQEMEGFVILHQVITYEGDGCTLLTWCNTSLKWRREKRWERGVVNNSALAHSWKDVKVFTTFLRELSKVKSNDIDCWMRST